MFTKKEKLNYLQRFRERHVDNCNKCHGDGSLCECQEKLELEKKKVNANIPIQQLILGFEDLVDKNIQRTKSKLESYVKDFPSYYDKGVGLYLWSDNKGTGKTTAACSILKGVLKQGYSGYFTTLDECLRMTFASWNDVSAKAIYTENIFNSDLLIIDDIGGREIKTSRNADTLQTLLLTIFKSRCENLKPTILTGNIPVQSTVKDLSDIYGERFYSVFVEHMKVFEFKNKDYRKTVLAKEILD